MEKIHVSQMSRILADLAVVLLSNGATTTRTVRNVNRIANTFGYKIEEFVSHSSLVLTIESSSPSTNNAEVKETIVRRIGAYHVNYSIISEVSLLSWQVEAHNVLFADLENKLLAIKKINSYPEWLKFVFIGLATAALAKIFNGTFVEFIVAFFAGVIGIYARKLAIVKKYNMYICAFVAAFVSTSVVNVFRMLGVQDYHGALAACVLWLIPGVPLINGFLDILEENIVSGWAKVAMGFMLVFMIGVYDRCWLLSVYFFIRLWN